MGEQSFVGHARTIGFFTLLSRVLGLIREMLCAHYFGAGRIWDAFAIAYRVPNLFRRLFGEGALTAAFIPAFVSRWETGREEEARSLFNRILTRTGLILLAFVAGGIAVTFLIPRISHDPKAALFSELLRIMLPYLLLICTAAILAATLQSLHQFTIPALAPVLLNVVWIAAVFTRSIHVVALSIAVGGLVQLAAMLPSLARCGLRFRPDLRAGDGVREVRASLLPVVFGLSLAQINELAGSVIAEFGVRGHGAVSALYYGNQLFQLPLSLIGVSIATAVFPALASPKEKLPPTIQKAMRAVLYAAIPATVGLLLFAREIVQLLFEHGAFRETDRTAWVLRVYALALWCYCANQVQIRAFYALKDMRTPVRVSAGMALVNLAANLVLVWPFGEAGVAAGAAASGLGSFVLLNHLLHRRLPSLELGPVRRTFLLSTIAAIAMAAAAWAVHRHLLIRAVPGSGLIAQSVRLFPAIFAAMAMYFIVTRFMGMAEAREIFRRKA